MDAPPDCLDAIFAARGAMAGHPADFRAAVIARGRRRTLDREEPVFHAGDDPGGIYGVVSGGIGAWRSGPRSSTMLSTILRSGDWFGMGPVLVAKPRTTTFCAMEPSVVLLLTLAALGDLQAARSDAARRLGALAMHGAELISDIAADLLIPTAERRIAAVLLRITAVEEGVIPGHPDGFMITQRELGEMANVSRSYVNATLAQFRRNGWLTLGYNRIAVLDSAALHGFAASE